MPTIDVPAGSKLVMPAGSEVVKTADELIHDASRILVRLVDALGEGEQHIYVRGMARACLSILDEVTDLRRK